jgi:hypothetical protein
MGLTVPEEGYGIARSGRVSWPAQNLHGTSHTVRGASARRPYVLCLTTYD